MAFKFNAITGKLDLIGSKTTEFDKDGFIMYSDNKKWKITIDDNGTIVATEIVSGTNTGKMMGLLCLTYS